MRKNRLKLYVILFVIAVAAMAIYAKKGSEQFSEEKVTSHVNNMRLGIQDIYNKFPIDDLEKTKEMHGRQLEKTAVATERVFGSYVELKEMGNMFGYYEEKDTETERILVHANEQISELWSAGSDQKLTAEQLEAFKEYYQYLYDLYQVDVYEMDLTEILEGFEKVSDNHKGLKDLSFLK